MLQIEAGPHRLQVPKGSAGRFHQRLSGLMSQAPEKREEMVYVVKEGDTLSEIAERHRVSVADVRAWNRLDPKQTIRPGMRLIILPGSN